MEGYSVTEAASVLGVPTERVWELLARGVLSGVPDGETGMRVFLQPRPAPPAVEEPRRSNGGSGREPEAEASPFRELLSEFRNLTERYGQALLALGESRGEVASLRSRVDLLEARFDLRLPISGSATAQPAAAGWNATQPAPRPTVEPIPAEEAAAAPEAEPSAPRRRRRGQHRATDDFAQALARAEDPSPAELPGGEEAAAAFAALRDEAAHRTSEHADATLPRELPAAEPIATIESDDIVEVVVPQPIAEAEAAVEEAPEPIVAAEAEVAVEEAPEPIGVAKVAVEEAPEPIVTAEAEVAVEEAPVPIGVAEVAVEEATEPIGEAPAVEAETIGTEPQLIVEGLATAMIEAETIVDSVPEPIEAAEEAPTAEPEMAFDGLPLDADSEAEPWIQPEPAAEARFEPELEPEPSAEPVTESPSAEAEPEVAIEAAPEPIAEAPAAPMAEPQPEPQLAVAEDSIDAESEAPPEPELAGAEDLIQAEPEAKVEAISETVVDEAEPSVELQSDEETEEPAEAEPASTWDEATQAEPLVESEVESEPQVDALADAEPSWNRDRYTARIEEPDWIPEERSPQPPSTTRPETEARFSDSPRIEPDDEGSDTEPSSSEPPWVGEPGRSTPTGEETMLWFGREPNRAAAADWPSEDDSAAEMEVASTGGHATRHRPVPDEPIAFRPAPAVPPADMPDVRAEYRASLRPQPPSPASRAYRRLRRIFPG